MKNDSRNEEKRGGKERKTTYTAAQSTSLNMSTQFYARKRRLKSVCRMFSLATHGPVVSPPQHHLTDSRGCATETKFTVHIFFNQQNH